MKITYNDVKMNFLRKKDKRFKKENKRSKRGNKVKN